jgi:co-chaperonin GroES (HSP10)|tara:strand:+ start:324 stop:611 length:288 start_codon:yes stop_codon:yes gene_type:complete
MLKPRNRHILITPDFVQNEQQRQQVGILLPEDYTEATSKYCAAKVLDVSPDVSVSVKDNSDILVDRAMIEAIEHNGETSYMILENYVIAQIEDDT